MLELEAQHELHLDALCVKADELGLTRVQREKGQGKGEPGWQLTSVVEAREEAKVHNCLPMGSFYSWTECWTI